MPLGSIEFTADGRISTKQKRLAQCRKANAIASASFSYKNNSTKEELCIEYLNLFMGQFMAMYPFRKMPFMITENEHGTKKFICTTIRPTEVQYPELFDLYECSSFIAGYVIYEPLENPFETPKCVMSPTQTLATHTGDCFELSTLLCSLLLGSGYDAYVVNGYAPKYITLRDQSMTQCPLVGGTAERSSSITKTSAVSTTSDDGTYTVPKAPQVESQFLKEEAEKKIREGLDLFQLWIPDEYNPDIKKEEIEKSKRERRVHSWVLVCAGRKDVKEHVFIEPSTGRIYPVTNSPYLGIESLWNNTNYWINLYVDKVMTEINFDLKNGKLWENCFVSSIQKAEKDDTADAEDKEEPETNDDDANFDTLKTFDAPPTWVSPLTLTRAQYLLRYPPNGKRTIQYYCAKADLYAKGVHSQSMVMRIVLYLDKECTIVNEIHEWFESRKDKMYKRVRCFLGPKKFIELYHPGSLGEVKQWVEYPGKSLEVDFYVNGRLDRLARRVEVVGCKIVEHFEGRTDQLIYRSVIMSTEKEASRTFSLPGSTLASELHVIKMTQKYERNPDVEPGTDIAKRVFYVAEGKVVSQYHFRRSQITNEVRTYLHTRGPSVPELTDQALSQEIGVVTDVEALQESATLERECFTAIKSSLQQLLKIVENHEEFEKNIIIERSVFENALNAANDVIPLELLAAAEGTVGGKSIASSATSTTGKGADRSQKEVKASDYLTPYLKSVKDANRITKDEALEIRQNCLDAFKARLVERANIIQARLNEENAKLGRKQEQFQRSQREGDLSTEEYEKYCTDAMFRIQILEQRLVTHEEAALKKFAELDQRLGNDPRLRILKA